MTERAPEPTGFPGVASRIGETLIGALPAQFLVLVLLNIVFIGCVLWFESHSIDIKAALMNRVLDSCMEQLETTKTK